MGNGKTLKGILNQNPKGVTAIDFSQEAINIVNSNNSFKKVRFIKSDVRELPFKDKSFDIVFVYFTLNNLLRKDRPIAVKEIYRVLNKTGKVLFQDFAEGDFRESNNNPKLVEKNTIMNKKGLICHFFTKKELSNLFKDFSIKRISIKTTKPIINKGHIKRKTISGFFNKA